MSKYALPEYDIYREWIRTARARGNTWEQIETGLTGSMDGLKQFLSNQSIINWWKINADDWKEIV